MRALRSFPALPVLLAGLVLAAALGLAACGSDSNSTTGETSGAPLEPGHDGAESTTPAEDQPQSTTPAGKVAPEAPLGARAGVCENDEAANGEVRVTGVSCGFGRLMVKGWNLNKACGGPPDASRTSCKLGDYICLGARTARGLAVTCAARGRSIAFLATPR
jgi:hypothetical protein